MISVASQSLFEVILSFRKELNSEKKRNRKIQKNTPKKIEEKKEKRRRSADNGNGLESHGR